MASNEDASINLMDQSDFDEYMSYGWDHPDLSVARKPYFRKTFREKGPTWAERKAYVQKLIETDNYLTEQDKVWLEEKLRFVPHYQFRGFKYGIATWATVFFFFPVIRRQMFLRRFVVSSVPFWFFMRWGYVGGHEKWWRQSYPIIGSYEIITGSRNKFSGK